jgi:predicted dehydrogenase
MARKIRAGVVGVGHFGRHHAAKYASLDTCTLTAVADIDAARAAEVAQACGTRAVVDHRALFGEVDAVSVAVPTRDHYAIARDFLERGVHALVEKPMTDSLESADALIALAERERLVLQVGHVERFSPTFEALRERIARPLYIEGYRISPFPQRGTDVDVVLDLMIHDIDLIQDLVGSPIVAVDAIGAPVLSSHEDIVNTRLRFANHCVANVTSSRVGTKSERRLRIFQADSYISVDFLESIIVSVRAKRNAAPADPFPFERDEWRAPKADPLALEIADFIQAVAEGRPPRVDGRAGREALRVAFMIGDSLRAHRDRLFGGPAP